MLNVFFFQATFEVLKHNSYSYCYSDFTSINRIYLLNFYPVTRCYVPCEQWFLVAQRNHCSQGSYCVTPFSNTPQTIH